MEASILKLKAILAAALVLAVMPQAWARDWGAREKVEVNWNGRWYPATVLKDDGNRFYVHFEDGTRLDDRWISQSYVRKRYGVGSRVEVKWKGEWYDAKITKVNGSKFFVHYAGYDRSFDQWVDRAAVR